MFIEILFSISKRATNIVEMSSILGCVNECTATLSPPKGTTLSRYHVPYIYRFRRLDSACARYWCSRASYTCPLLTANKEYVYLVLTSQE